MIRIFLEEINFFNNKKCKFDMKSKEIILYNFIDSI